MTVIGSSKGAELAAVLPQYYPQIDNVMLFAPGSYVYQGLDFQHPASSWTYHGAELPYIGFNRSSIGATASMISAFMFNYPVSFRDTYQTAVQRTPDPSVAKIPIDKLEGNLAVFAGDADRMWQSEVAARELQQAKPERTEVFVYPGAGHVFAGDGYIAGMALGGTEDANRQALEDSRHQMARLLTDWHR